MPSTEELRELGAWEPALGVVSVYLGFPPGDRSTAWRTELRNGVERLRAEAEGGEHERRVALRATAERLLERYDDDETRPPPRGEAGFVEVAERGGEERWFASGVEPATPGQVALAPQPLLAPLVELTGRGAPHGVAVISSEQVRLLRFAAGQLEQIEEWEMSYFERDWRERKSQSPGDPARAQGVSSSGRDQYDQRLEHNRERFLAEAGKLAGDRFAERGIGDALVIGPAGDWAEFGKGIAQTAVRAASADRDDLISVPTGQLSSQVEAAVERARAERDGAVVARALGEGDGRPGALGVQDTAEALGEGRVERLVLDAAIGVAASRWSATPSPAAPRSRSSATSSPRSWHAPKAPPPSSATDPPAPRSAVTLPPYRAISNSGAGGQPTSATGRAISSPASVEIRIAPSPVT